MILAPTVFIEADLPSFTFRYGSKTVVLPAYLYISTAEKPVVLAVGSHPQDSSGATRVDLFGQPLQPVNYSEHLETFLRQGISMVASGWARIIRPQFRIRVSRRLVELTGGYYDGVFRSAALQAGAPKSQTVFIQAVW